jgi:hypothetical protein
MTGSRRIELSREQISVIRSPISPKHLPRRQDGPERRAMMRADRIAVLYGELSARSSSRPAPFRASAGTNGSATTSWCV